MGSRLAEEFGRGQAADVDLITDIHLLNIHQWRSPPARNRLAVSSRNPSNRRTIHFPSGSALIALAGR